MQNGSTEKISIIRVRLELFTYYFVSFFFVPIMHSGPPTHSNLRRRERVKGNETFHGDGLNLKKSDCVPTSPSMFGLNHFLLSQVALTSSKWREGGNCLVESNPRKIGVVVI